MSYDYDDPLGIHVSIRIYESEKESTMCTKYKKILYDLETDGFQGFMKLSQY